MYLLYIFPPRAPRTYDFVVLTSLTQPRKIILVVLQIGKAKDLSAPLRTVFTRLQGDTSQKTGKTVNLVSVTASKKDLPNSLYKNELTHVSLQCDSDLGLNLI
jgi:hypothetical protein